MPNDLISLPTFAPYSWADLPNRYRGRCSGCGDEVFAGEGFYLDGTVYCDRPGSLGDKAYLCPVAAERELKALANPKPAPAPRERTAAEIAAEAERHARRAAEDAAWAARGLTRCTRCYGAGGASHWPGFTCFECGGAGAIVHH